MNIKEREEQRVTWVGVTRWVGSFLVGTYFAIYKYRYTLVLKYSVAIVNYERSQKWNSKPFNKVIIYIEREESVENI